LQKNSEVAHTLAEESLLQALELGHWLTIASCLEALALVILAQEKTTWAARLWGAAEVLRQAIEAPLPPVKRPVYEQAVATARSQLGEQLFVAAWSEGRAMTPEQAFAARGPVTSPVEAQAPPPAKSPSSYPAGLTAREVEVLRLVAQGLTDAQVAAQLVISPRTVNFHLTSIYSKIGVSSRAAATRYAIEEHLL
jgi:DNA-binding CsgD family transcriptional regulator